MQGFWEEELTADETERLLDRAADEIRRRRLEAPAILALEMHRPLMGLAAHAMVAFAPFVVPLLGYEGVHDLSRLLKDRQNAERLIQRLECPVEG